MLLSLEYRTVPHYTQVMSLTSHSSHGSESLVSLQLSPTPSPTSGHRRNSSGAESSRTVMPSTKTRPHRPQKDVLAALKRTRASQQSKKSRSKITGLHTPFHVDTRRRPQGILSSVQLPSRSLKGKTKQHQRITNVDTVSNKSAVVRPLTKTILQDACGMCWLC